MNLAEFIVSVFMNETFRDIVLSVTILLLGIILGKIADYVIKKAFRSMKLERIRGYSFFELFRVIIKWSVYILFLSLALKELAVPEFTNWLTDILYIIPALVGALLLIIVGFAIASYLKTSVEDSRIEGWQILSEIFFYFILYVFLVFAIKTALITFDNLIVNIAIIIFTAAGAFMVAYKKVKKR